MKRLVIALSLAAMSLMAADFSSYTLEELEAMRGTVAVEDRDDFRAEMQSRLQDMTPEERAAYLAARRAAGPVGAQDGTGVGSMNRGSNNQGQGIKQRLQDGSGAGSMSQGANKGGKN